MLWWLIYFQLFFVHVVLLLAARCSLCALRCIARCFESCAASSRASASNETRAQSSSTRSLLLLPSESKSVGRSVVRVYGTVFRAPTPPCGTYLPSAHSFEQQQTTTFYIIKPSMNLHHNKLNLIQVGLILKYDLRYLEPVNQKNCMA